MIIAFVLFCFVCLFVCFLTSSDKVQKVNTYPRISSFLQLVAFISKSKVTTSPSDKPVRVFSPGLLSPSLQWAVQDIWIPSGALSISSIFEVMACCRCQKSGKKVQQRLKYFKITSSVRLIDHVYCNFSPGSVLWGAAPQTNFVTVCAFFSKATTHW